MPATPIILLFLVAELVVFLVGWLLGRFSGSTGRASEKSVPRDRLGAGALIGVVAAIALILSRCTTFDGRTPTAIGVAIGAMGPLAAHVLTPGRRATTILPLGTIGILFLYFLPPASFPPALVGAIVGAGVAALILGGPITSDVATTTIVLATLTRISLATGAQENMRYAGVAAAVALSLVALAEAPLRRKCPTATATGLAVLSGLIGAELANGYLHLPTLAITCLVAGGGAAVMGLMVPEDTGRDAFRPALSALFALSLATYAFSAARGYGIAFAAIIAILPLLGTNSRTATTFAPLLGLGLYRLFREIHPDSMRAIDIGQHYTLVGLLIGVILPRLVCEWYAPTERPAAAALGRTLWVITLGIAAPLGIVLLGAKGAIGLVVGAGFGAALIAEPAVPALSLAVGALFAAEVSLVLTALGDAANMDRIAKVRWVAGGGISLTILGILLALIASLRRPDGLPLAGSGPETNPTTVGA